MFKRLIDNNKNLKIDIKNKAFSLIGTNYAVWKILKVEREELVIERNIVLMIGKQLIYGGEHFMIVVKAAEISEIINNEVKKIQPQPAI